MEMHGSGGTRSIPAPLRWFWLAIVLLTLVAYGFTFGVNRLHAVRSPAYTLLPWPLYDNADFLCFAQRFASFGKPQFFGQYSQPFNYPAPVALIYEAFFGLFHHAVLAFVRFSIFVYAAATAFFAWLLVKRGIGLGVAIAFSVSVLMLSYPIALMFLLSNMEFAVWVALASGTIAYVAGHRRVGSALFGLAASLKYYPIVFLGLPIAERRYRIALLGAVCCLGSLCGSFILVAHHMYPLASAAFSSDLATFNARYVSHYNFLEAGIDHSVFELFKMPLAHLGHYWAARKIIKPYLLLAAVSGIALYFARIRHLELTNQIFVLTILSITLPPVSHDYTLVHLYVPWAMLVLIMSTKGGWMLPGAIPSLACFAILFTPQNFLLFGNFHYGGQLKALVLLALLVLALRHPFPWVTADKDPVRE